jgi:hypothetical protein
MEREHPEFRFDLGDEVFESTPDNTLAFIHQHEDDSMFDHIFLVTSNNPDEPNEGYFAWRGGVGNFDEVVESMRECGFTVIDQSRVAKGDRDAYFKSHEAKLKTQTLTPRQERLADFTRYILETEHLVAEDFVGAGELYL